MSEVSSLQHNGAGVPDGPSSFGTASRSMESPDGVSYEQNVAGIRQAYRDFVRFEAGLEHIGRVLRNEIEPPHIRVSIPTGGKDDDGNQIVVDIDLLDLVRKLAKGPDDTYPLLAGILGPLYSYLALNYSRVVQRLAQHASATATVVAASLVSGGQAGGST